MFHWCKPDAGVLKFNNDGAFTSHACPSGFGVVARTSEGCLVDGFQSAIMACSFFFFFAAESFA